MPDAKADKTPPRSSYGQYELLYDEEIEKEKHEKKGKTYNSHSARSFTSGRLGNPSSWK